MAWWIRGFLCKCGVHISSLQHPNPHKEKTKQAKNTEVCRTEDGSVLRTLVLAKDSGVGGKDRV